jgi:DNA replication protein DnaC
MDQQLLDQLRYLKLSHILDNWDAILQDANRAKPSYHRFLSQAIADEYQHQRDQQRISRTKRARLPELLTMETFPFSRQPKLDRRKVMDLYDSQRFLSEAQAMLFIGPTGCGKTGLASAFLIQAINNGYRCRFLDFKDLTDQLYRSLGDRSDRSLLKHLATFDCLLIDELGYDPMEKAVAGLFFSLIKQRHRKRCTIITTQLGFSEWGALLGNEHLSAALIDRITENCTVFNMSKCISIRPKKIDHATTQSSD